ncbi:MAG: nicotinamide-nucleotide amidohydrolase family protein [Alphaproteobacteria bacterium]|nr:nicotinamide-nucleotide amidohydrolase family protein [Alphaproteobacteria bacterium]
MPFRPELLKLAETVLSEARARTLRIVTAESCTGGLVAAVLTEIPGSSDVLQQGWVTYSNESKQQELGVPEDTLRMFGAVSEATARAMAHGALQHGQADVSVSVTGVAGPGGGTAEKPVGLVHFAAARRGREIEHEERRFGPLSRHEIRMASVEVALNLLRRMVQ